MRTTYDEQRARAAAGRTIRAAREAEGLTLRGLAEEVDLDFSYLRKIEAGEQTATVAVYARLAYRLRVDLGDPLGLVRPRRGGARARGSRSVSRVSMARTITRPGPHS